MVFASGLNSDSSIDLDAQGNGEFYLYSRGAVTTDDIPSVTITAQLVQPLGEQQSAVQNSPAQEDEAEVVVKLPKRGLWTKCLDAVGGFFGADTETGWGLTAGVAGSVLMVGDIGSAVKNLWRMTGFWDRDPNYIELGLSGFGILSTAGSPLVDGPIAVARSLAAQLGRSAGKSKFLEVLIKTTRHADDLPVAELTRRNAFCQLIKRDADAITVFDAVVKESAEVTVSQAAKVSEKLGQQFVDTIKSIATNPKYGAKTAQRTVHVLGELSDEVLESLKASGRFSEAVDGLSSVLKKGAKKGVDPETMKAVLHNRAAYSDAYKHADLLIDLGKIADADGIEVLITRLKNPNLNVAKGHRYELQVASQFAREGKKIQFVEKLIENYSDIDIIADNVFYQVKLSAVALKSPDSVKLWIGRARASGATEIKYVVPPDVTIPVEIQKVFNLFKSEVLRVPFH